MVAKRAAAAASADWSKFSRWTTANQKSAGIAKDLDFLTFSFCSIANEAHLSGISKSEIFFFTGQLYFAIIS